MSVFGSHVTIRGKAQAIGASINHDARQGERLREGSQAVELHVAASGKLREPPRVKLDKVGRGQFKGQWDRVGDKLTLIERKLKRTPDSKVLLDLRKRYLNRLIEMGDASEVSQEIITDLKRRLDK